MSTGSKSAADERRRLVERLLRERGLGPKDAVVAVPRREPLRASFAQERMWFWDQATWPRSFLHNVPLSARLRGPIDPAALQVAIDRLVARQEQLRSALLLEGPVVFQRIRDQVHVPLRLVDLSSEPDSWASYQRFCLDEVCGVFDITTTPLLRTTLVRLAADDHVLVVCAHHVIWDGWSTGLLVYELAAHYRQARGLGGSLPDPRVQYADWAAWQRRHLSGEQLASHEAFWRDELSGVRTVHLAPALGPPGGRVGDGGATVSYSIPAELTQALQQLARAEGATLFMVLLAGLTALLHGLSGEDDLTVGGLIANRTTGQIGDVIGYFVNTVPIRSRRVPGRTFLEHLRAIRERALRAFEHQAFPIGRIARGVADRRPQGWDEPLYSIDFMLQTVERPEPDFGELSIEVPDFNTGTADYDMGCIMWQRTSDLTRSQGLQCWWEYKTDLFDERAIRSLIGRFLSTLAHVAREPDMPVLDLPVRLPGERDHTLVRGGDPEIRSDGVVEAIARNARTRGNAAAVVGPDGTLLSWSELDTARVDLTPRLVEAGAGPGAVVSVHPAPETTALVGVYAALSCGAAFQLEETGRVGAPSAARGDREALPADLLVRVRGSELRVRASSGPPGSAAPSPQNGAQVRLAADSTGHPAAVGVTRRGLDLTVDNVHTALALGPSDRVLLDAPPLREAEAWQVLAPLASGATLELMPEDAALDTLVARLATGITVLQTRPDRLSGLLDAWISRRAPAVRAVVVSGDRLARSALARWAHALPDIALFRAYTPPAGPGVVMLHRVDPAAFITEPWDPIGLPAPGNTSYILDILGRPVLPGAAGRLFVGGAALGSGFVGEPRRTAERFVPDPFSPHPGARMFDTGERARRRHDGLLERFDAPPASLRIGGRIARPADVDVALAAHPRVRKVVTIPVRGPDDAWRLVSYFVPTDAPTRADEEALTAWWAQVAEPAATLDDVLGPWRNGADAHVLVVAASAPVGSAPGVCVVTPTELVDVPHDHYDLVLLHGVSHRQPGEAHLRQVLTTAVARARLGGRVVVTGVRHLALRGALHCVRQLEAATDDAPFSPVRAEAVRRLRHDPELAIDPAHIGRVARALPRVSRVLVHPHGRYEAPDAPFLVDVSIAVGEATAPAFVAEQTWTDDASLQGLAATLEGAPAALVVRGIPDRRVLEALAVERGFDETVPGARVRDMRRATGWRGEAVHPGAIATLARAYGYTATQTLDPGSLGRFSATLVSGAPGTRAAARNPPVGLLTEARVGAAPDAGPPSNSPARIGHRWAAIRELRAHLQTRVPSERPALLIAVDDIGQLPDGAPDTHALPPPRQGAGHLPEHPFERALAETWGDATGTLAVGLDDHFAADFGAHPVLVAAVAEALGHTSVVTADMIAAPTIAALAATLRTRDEGVDHVG